MDTTGIYHWTFGEVALARISKNVYARVKVVKNEKGLFYGEKVLGISCDENGNLIVKKEMCYYVEMCRNNDKMWLPYTCMYLAERSRPYYGSENNIEKNKQTPQVASTVSKKTKIKSDETMQLDEEPKDLKDQDLKNTLEERPPPPEVGHYEGAYRDFIRRGKDAMFDEYYLKLINDLNTPKEVINYLHNVNTSTESKVEFVLRNVGTIKEIENYLHQCWRYNYNANMNNIVTVEEINSEETSFEKETLSVHAPWCLVCGKDDLLNECMECPSSYHLSCVNKWSVNIIHRKNPPKKNQEPSILVDKILSGTRTKCVVIEENKENMELCPSCTLGPNIGFGDVVWYKLGSCPWWPARVLTPGTTPMCLLTRYRTMDQLPLKFYGTMNHTWGDSSRMCLFMPQHSTSLEDANDPILRKAILDACDDYITVYLA